MPMNERELKTISEWLISKWGSLNCDRCKSGTYQTGEIIAGLPEGADGKFGMKGNIVPRLQLICKECGSVSLLDSRKVPRQ